jgi:hypothetical protein
VRRIAPLVISIIAFSALLTGCSAQTAAKATPPKTCTPASLEKINGAKDAKTTAIRLSTTPLLRYVLKGRTDVVCSAKATMTLPGDTAPRTLFVAELSTPIKKVVPVVDKVMFDKADGGRGIESGQDDWSWTYGTLQDALEAGPVDKTHTVLIEQ